MYLLHTLITGVGHGNHDLLRYGPRPGQIMKLSLIEPFVYSMLGCCVRLLKLRICKQNQDWTADTSCICMGQISVMTTNACVHVFAVLQVSNDRQYLTKITNKERTRYEASAEDYVGTQMFQP